MKKKESFFLTPNPIKMYNNQDSVILHNDRPVDQ